MAGASLSFRGHVCLPRLLYVTVTCFPPTIWLDLLRAGAAQTAGLKAKSSSFQFAFNLFPVVARLQNEPHAGTLHAREKGSHVNFFLFSFCLSSFLHPHKPASDCREFRLCGFYRYNSHGVISTITFSLWRWGRIAVKTRASSSPCWSAKAPLRRQWIF